MNINERFDRLDAFIAEDRLTRKLWGDGQERACLMLALAPEARDRDTVECTANFLPPWLARITPSMDDCGSEAAWPTMVRRYSVVVRRGATTLDDVGWRRVLARTMLAVLARATTFDTSGSCARVSTLWGRVLSGEEPLKGEWAAERGAAPARTSTLSGAWARSAAGSAAAGSAIAAAWATANAEREKWEATWDCMTTAILDGIELECGEPRARREEGA